MIKPNAITRATTEAKNEFPYLRKPCPRPRWRRVRNAYSIPWPVPIWACNLDNGLRGQLRKDAVGQWEISWRADTLTLASASFPTMSEAIAYGPELLALWLRSMAQSLEESETYLLNFPRADMVQWMEE